MKKRLISLILTTIICILSLFSCSFRDKDNDNDEDGKQNLDENIIFDDTVDVQIVVGEGFSDARSTE